MKRILSGAATFLVYSLILLPGSHAAEGNFLTQSELFFPETAAWVSVADAPVVERADFDRIKEQLRSAYRGSRMTDAEEDNDCSFISRALDEANRTSFRRLDVDGDGIPDILYTGSGLCREGGATLVWFGRNNGFEIRQPALWAAVTLKVLPANKPRISWAEAACCGGTVDEYGVGDLDNIRMVEVVKTANFAEPPKTHYPKPEQFKNARETVLRSSPRRLDAYDASLSEVQGAAVFGNILSKFLPGVTGKALAEYRDRGGRAWCFVLLDDSNDVLRYHSPFSVNAGWVEKSCK